MERLGLPRYAAAADDLPGIRSELRDGAGFALVWDVVSHSADAGDCLTRFGQALGRLLPQNAKQEVLVEIVDFPTRTNSTTAVTARPAN